jgi:hypothetical protein
LPDEIGQFSLPAALAEVVQGEPPLMVGEDAKNVFEVVRTTGSAGVVGVAVLAHGR